MNQREKEKSRAVTISLDFQGNLRQLLSRRLAGKGVLSYVLRRRTSIKDLIESLGVPHTEVERLLVNGREVSFACIPADGDVVEVVPLRPGVDVTVETLLRPHPLNEISFVVDVNVGKLAPLLRLAGFDAICEQGLSDSELAALAVGQRRIMLTRNRGLLKRRQVEYGYLVRSDEPGQQLVEVIELFGLASALKPFSRCLVCNHGLEPVAKEDIAHRLESLTRKYYDLFSLCIGCGRLYWQGSHHRLLRRYLRPFGVDE